MKIPTVPILLLNVLLGAPAIADPFPHEPGRIWRYETPSGQHDVVTAGPPISIPLDGYSVLAQPFVFGPGGAHAGFTEWFEFTADGSVRLVQSTDANGVGFRYDPPLVLLPSAVYRAELPIVLSSRARPLPAGAENTIFYWLDATIAPITVPFGSFNGLSGTLRALAIPGTEDYVADVWVDGVGCVQYHDGEDFRLTGVDAATAALPTTWGALKRIYR